MNSIKIKVSWIPVVDVDGNIYKFPAPFPRAFKERYDKPLVYRRRVSPIQSAEKEIVYIGEAEDLHQRIQRVLRPSKAPTAKNTNRQLNDFLSEQRSQNRDILLEIADFEPFEINGVRFSPDNLYDKFRRLTIENILLCLAQAEGQALKNKYELPLILKIKKLPLSQKRKIINAFEAKWLKMS